MSNPLSREEVRGLLDVVQIKLALWWHCWELLMRVPTLEVFVQCFYKRGLV